MNHCIYCRREFTPENAGQDPCSTRCTRAYVLAAHRNRADIVVEDDGGSIVILRGMTDRGYEWIETNCHAGDFNPFGLGARLCEPRYLAPIVEGMKAAGLKIEAR